MMVARHLITNCHQMTLFVHFEHVTHQKRGENGRISQRLVWMLTTLHMSTHLWQHKNVEEEYPGILQDPDRLWNMNETAGEAEYGRRVKVFLSSKSMMQGRRRNLRESGKHLTAVLCGIVSGLLTPLFCIVQGKNCMERWLERLRERAGF